MLAQARQARADLEEFSRAAMRASRQWNANGVLDQVVTGLGNTLRETGPLGIRQLWDQLAGDERFRAGLTEPGLTPDLQATMGDVIAKADATVSLRAGRISVESRVQGAAAPRQMAIAPGDHGTGFSARSGLSACAIRHP